MSEFLLPSPLPDRNGLGVSIAERVISADFDPQGNPTTAGFSLTTERRNGYVDDYELTLWGKVFEANPQQGAGVALAENIECTISPKGINVSVNWGDAVHLIDNILMLSVLPEAEECDPVYGGGRFRKRNLINPPYFAEYHISGESLSSDWGKTAGITARVDIASNTFWGIHVQIVKAIQSGHISDVELRKIVNPHFVESLQPAWVVE